MVTIERFGKEISYHIDEENNKSCWMLVREGVDEWLYTTKKDMKMPVCTVLPLVLNRKSMIDLLVHFHCEKSVIDDFKKQLNHKMT